jgi:hypothetical protein
MANGQPFEARGIYLQPLFGRWSMTIADQPLDSPTGFLPSGYQAVNVSGLPRDLRAGTYRKSMQESGGGHFQIRSPDDPTTTTSWNSPNAYVLELTRWEVADYDPNASMFQVAGRASGRIVVVYRGYNDGRFQNSWVAGSFTDVPVRYMGEPRWEQE